MVKCPKLILERVPSHKHIKILPLLAVSQWCMGHLAKTLEEVSCVVQFLEQGDEVVQIETLVQRFVRGLVVRCVCELFFEFLLEGFVQLGHLVVQEVLCVEQGQGDAARSRQFEDVELSCCQHPSRRVQSACSDDPS